MKLIACSMLLAATLGARADAHAQWLDRTRQSPMELMAGPVDGVEYYKARVRANTLMSLRDYAAAESVFVRLAKEYPRDGMNWLRLSQAQVAQKKFADAAQSYERAGGLMGWGPFYLAGAYAPKHRLAAGDTTGALKLLAEMVFDRHSVFRQDLYDDPAFASLRAHAEFRRITGHPDTRGWTRDEGWRRDIDYVRDEIIRTTPDYRGAPLPPEFERRYKQLTRDVPGLSDEEIFVGMNRMLAVLRAGHTSLFIPTGSRYLPIRPYAFPEGVFIIDASDTSLVGSRIVNIGRFSADSLLRLMSQESSDDGDMETLWNAHTMAMTHHLKGLGAITRTDSVPVSIETRSGARRTVTLATQGTAPEERQDKLVAPRGVKAPLFLRDLNQNHWAQVLPEHGALYVQFNNVVNDDDETLAAFGRRLATVLDSARPKNVIIDMRHNNGGATILYVELLRTLTAFSRLSGNQVYALIGRRTYSATANFITDLERLVRPIWVGEASSECCNLHGDPTHVTLPYSKIEGEFSVVRWNLSGNVFDERREMSPDVPVQLTAKAYFAGLDPALDAVFRLIDGSRTRH